jgi:hypothetical protein
MASLLSPIRYSVVYMEQLLLIMGASIFGLLGVLHFIYTFYTNKFSPYDSSATAAMQATSPRLTRDTTVWRAWIGFNASHSLGAVSFAAIYIPLTVSYFSVIQSSLWLSLLPVVVGTSYLVLAKLYWFKIPFVGIALALMCFVGAAWLING